MKIFETLEDYKKVAQIGDIITLGGNSLIDGLKPNCKNDCFKVYKLDSSSGFVGFKKYNSKLGLTTGTQQKVGLIENKFYKNLPKY